MADNQLNLSLQQVIQSAIYENNLARGLHEVCKALESNYTEEGKPPALCVLAEDCAEAKYKQLIVALCKQQGVSLIKVAQRTQLGEWANLCKKDATGTARKIRGCSSLVIKEFSKNDEAAVNLIKQHL